MLDEADFKAIALNYLRQKARLSPPALIASEFMLPGDAARADLAILSERRLIGIEVKSERDNLKRLQAQMAAYRIYFDETLLFVSYRHVSALNIDDIANVETFAISCTGRVQKLVRRPQVVEGNKPSYLEMLTQGERRRFGKLAPSRYESKPLRTSPKTFRQGWEPFAAAFLSRYGQTSQEFWRLVEGRDIDSSDLHELSRFKGRRIEHQNWLVDRRSKWQLWPADITHFNGNDLSI